jgi:two-component system sensor kinase FixL
MTSMIRSDSTEAVAEKPDQALSGPDRGHAGTAWSEDSDKPAAGSRRVEAATPKMGRRLFRTMTLRTYLVAMTLVVLIPSATLGAIATELVVREYQDAYKERMRATARLLGIALDAEIQMRKTAITALADSPLIDAPSGQALYDYAKQIGDEFGAWVTIRTREEWLINTRLPPGTPPGRPAEWDPVRDAYFHVTNIVRIPDVPTPFVAAIGPIVRGGKAVGKISIPFSHDQLGRRLAEGLVTSDGVLCLLDGNGDVVARTRRHEQYIGSRVPAWLLAAIQQPEQAIATGSLADGGEVIAATAHPSLAPHWTVVIAQPIAGYYQEWFRPLMVLGGGGLVLLLVLIALVYWLSAWLVRPLTALTASAGEVAQGRDGSLPEGLLVSRLTSRVAEFEALRARLGEAAEVMEGRARAISAAFATARRERNLLHSVVNGTTDPTFVRDARGKLVLVNESGLKLLGMPAGEAIGHVRPEPGARTAASARAEDVEVFTSGRAMTIERSIVIDGERRTYLGTKSPWRSPSGDVLGVVVIIHDITEWKRSEDRLRHIQAELIRTGRLSAMGAMATGLAHELNQPLAAITNFLGAARRLLDRSMSDEPAARQTALQMADGALEDASAQSLRAGEIVSRLRDFIGRGASSMRNENIGDLIRDACAMAMPQDIRSRVGLILSIESAIEPAFVDRLQIQQVLVNVILNALQAMDHSARRELSISAERDAAGGSVIRLSDTGPGIPDTMMTAIFEPFVTTREKGLGMGLAIARMIAVAHGGALIASNNPGGGATFTLVLPPALTMEAADG